MTCATNIENCSLVLEVQLKKKKKDLKIVTGIDNIIIKISYEFSIVDMVDEQ